MHRFQWEWDSTPTFNQFVAFVVNPLRSKMSEVLINIDEKNEKILCLYQVCCPVVIPALRSEEGGAMIAESPSPKYFLDSFPRDAFPQFQWTARPPHLPQAA